MKKYFICCFCIFIFVSCFSSCSSQKHDIEVYISSLNSGSEANEIPGLSAYYRGSESDPSYQEYGNQKYDYVEDNIPNLKFEIDNWKVENAEYIKTLSVHREYHESNSNFTIVLLADENGQVVWYCRSTKQAYFDEKKAGKIYTDDECYERAIQYAEECFPHQNDMTLCLISNKQQVLVPAKNATWLAEAKKNGYKRFDIILDWKYDNITIARVDIVVDNFGEVLNSELDSLPAATFFDSFPRFNTTKCNDIIQEQITKVLEQSEIELEYTIDEIKFCVDNIYTKNPYVYIRSLVNLSYTDDFGNVHYETLIIKIPIELIT